MKLIQLNISNNRFEDLPDLGTTQPTSYTVDANELTFEDLLPLLDWPSFSGKASQYTNQANQGMINSISINAGHDWDWQLSFDQDVTSNYFLWYKDNVLVDSTDIGLFSVANFSENDQGIYQIIQRLLFLFTENHPSKEFFVDNMLVELIVRILQTNQRKIHLSAGKDQVNNNRISAVVNYILMNLDKPLTIEELGAVAHMSTSNLHRVFKNEMGTSPVNFVNIERIRRAMDLLRDPNISIKEVYIRCGFQNRSYFNRLFRKVSSLSPNEYQIRMAKGLGSL